MATQDSSTAGARSRGDIIATWRFALADGGLVLLLFALPHAIGSDGRVRFMELAQLLSGGGIPTAVYSLVGPLFSAPLYWLGLISHSPAWWCAHYNAILACAGVITLGAAVRQMAGARIAGTFALVLVTASMVPNPVRNYFGEMFTAVTVSAGLFALTQERIGVGTGLLALGVANMPPAAVGLSLAVAAFLWDRRQIRYAMPLAAAAALIVAESWLRRGTLFDAGYVETWGARTVLPYSGLPGFSYPLGFGLLSVLLSFGKGLIFFAPGLLLSLGKGVPEGLRMWWRCLLWFVAGMLLVYAKWWAWFAGWTWGPRFFLLASIPASLAVAVARERYRSLGSARLALLTAALVLSTWVAIDGGAIDLANLGACNEGGETLQFLCWYVPEFSALWRPFVVRPAFSAGEALFACYCAGVCLWLVLPLVAELGRRAGVFVKAEAPWRLRALRW